MFGIQYLYGKLYDALGLGIEFNANLAMEKEK